MLHINSGRNDTIIHTLIACSNVAGARVRVCREQVHKEHARMNVAGVDVLRAVAYLVSLFSSTCFLCPLSLHIIVTNQHARARSTYTIANKQQMYLHYNI